MTDAETTKREGQAGRRRERGVVSVFVVIALIVLVGFVALAIDNGYVLATRSQLQNASDAAALAAAVSIREGSTLAGAASDAVATAARNRAGDSNVVIDAGDVEFGSFDFDAREFVPGGYAGVTAVRVTASRDAGSAQGPLQLLLAPVLGLDSADVVAAATAALGRRDVMLVQDVSGSFRDELPQARDALRDFSNATAAQGLSGDRIGLAIFSNESRLERPLSDIPEELSPLIGTINSFPHSDAIDEFDGYTDIGDGLDEGIDELLAKTRRSSQQVIILVSDGVPCPSSRRQPALDAVDRADAEDISIFTVYLDQPGTTTCSGTTQGDSDFMRQLISGFGKFYETTNPNDLDDILVSIVAEMPMVLVE